MLLMLNCCPSHLLNDFIKLTLSQFLAEIYEDDFDAFSLLAEVRLLPVFVKGSNHPSLYN